VLAESDDTGGDTDFAANWRPDRVMGESGHAIADAANLTTAQAAPELQQPTENLRSQQGAQEMPLFGDVLANALEREAAGSPDAMKIVDFLRNDPQFVRMEREAQVEIVKALVLPSFGNILMQPVFSAMEEEVRLGRGGVPTMKGADAGEGSKRSRIPFVGGCSLAGMPEGEIEASNAWLWEGIKTKLSDLANWLWDVIVPDADAACSGTANGVQDAGEFCDTNPHWGHCLPGDQTGPDCSPGTIC